MATFGLRRPGGGSGARGGDALRSESVPTRFGGGELSSVGVPVAGGKRVDRHVVALGVPQAFGQRRSDPSLNGIGTINAAGRNRHYFHELVGLGAVGAGGKRSDRHAVGLGVPVAFGQQSPPPHVIGLGVGEAFGQRVTGAAHMIALGTTDASGHRAAQSAGEMSGVGGVESTALAHPDLTGIGETVGGGDRLFKRVRMAPGWIKIRGREEGYTSTPQFVENPLRVEPDGDSIWYDYDPATDPPEVGFFYPENPQFLRLDDMTLIFLYQTRVTWVPPEGGPYNYYQNQWNPATGRYDGYYTAASPRWEYPVCARRVTFDPMTAVATFGPQIILTGHPLVDGAGDNQTDPRGPQYNSWLVIPDHWTAAVASSTATTARIVFRMYDEYGFYDPYPGRGEVPSWWGSYFDYGYPSAGVLTFTFDWNANTVVKGPFRRLGGDSVGLVVPRTEPDTWHENFAQYDYWGWNENGERKEVMQMLTATRGVTFYANSGMDYADYQLCVESFDVNPDGTISIVGFFTYYTGSQPPTWDNSLSPYFYARLVPLTATRLAVFTTTNRGSQGTWERCWSFTVDQAGQISENGVSFLDPTSTASSYPYYYGVFPVAKVWNDRVVFTRYSSVTDGWKELWQVHFPETGAPVMSRVLPNEKFCHPENVYYQNGLPRAWIEGEVLEGDGKGTWAAVFRGWPETPPYGNETIYGLAGLISTAGIPAEQAEASRLRVMPDGEYLDYSLWWSAFLDPNWVLYGYYSDVWTPNGYKFGLHTMAAAVRGGPNKL